MKIITLLNEKGGVGKTTLATHVAAGLTIRGNRVVLIDADAQGHATTSFAMPKEPGLYNLLARDAEWENELRVPLSETITKGTLQGDLYVLPSNVETRVIPMVIDDALLLRERVAELEADYVVIDTSPTPSMLHAMIYFTTDYILYPTECEALSLDGLNGSIAHMRAINKQRVANGMPEIQLLGIQPTMYRTNTNAHDEGLRLLTSTFKRQAFPAIPQRTIWVEGAWARQMLFAYAPDHEATIEASALVERVRKGVA